MQRDGNIALKEEARSAEQVRDRRPSDAEAAAEALVVGNLIEALTRLQQDLDRVELWTAALSCFLRPVPNYQPSQQYLLPPLRRTAGQPD